MEFDDVYNFFYGLIFVYPLISMAAVLVVGIIIYLKPTETVKTLALFTGILIFVYIMSYLTGATKSGFVEEGKWVNKTVEKMEGGGEEEED